MKKIKNIFWLIIPLLAFASCFDYYDDDPYDEVVYQEDYLIGGSWHWTKTVWYDDVPNGFSYVDYAHDDLSYFFERGGHVSIRSTFDSRYGRSYSDWIDGRWNLYHGDLHIDTYNGSWTYQLKYIDDWSMVLVYYDEYYDDWGNVIPRKVEEYYER